MPSESQLANLELERAVLAVILDGRHRDAMAVASATLASPVCFSDRNHRLVYLAACITHGSGGHVDTTTVADHLSKLRFDAALDALRKIHEAAEAESATDKAALRSLYRVKAEEVGWDDSCLCAIGGRSYLEDLAVAFAPVAGFEANCKLVADYYAKRRLVAALDRARDEVFRTPQSSLECVSSLSRRITAIGAGDTREMRPIAAAVDDVERRMHEPKTQPVRTGIEKLDDKLAFRPGGLYILAATPGAGKTTLALSIAAAVAETKRVLFWSLEVDAIDLTNKLCAARSGVDFGRIERGDLDVVQRESVGASLDAIRALHLQLNDGSHAGVQQVRAILQRAMMGSDPPALAVIDYIQLMASSSKDHSEYERISEITRTLKVTARDLRLPILALSQLNRDTQRGDTNTKPRLSSLRGSGSLEQDADAVLFLHQTGVVKESAREMRQVSLLIAKNRFGPVGEIPMHFDPAAMRIEPANKPVKVDARDMNAARPKWDDTRQARLQRPPSPDEEAF